MPSSAVMDRIVSNMEPPYYAVIFTSQRTDNDEGYGVMADRMVELAAQQPGFLGVETTRDAAGLGITVSYWKSLEAIRQWRDQSEHRVAQQMGRDAWYSKYQLRICRVEREYGFAGVERREGAQHSE